MNPEISPSAFMHRHQPPNPATSNQAITFTVSVVSDTSTDGETVILRDASNTDAIVPTTDPTALQQPRGAH